MMTTKLFKAVGALALVGGGLLVAQVTNSNDGFRDFVAGEKCPEPTHAYFQLPPGYQPDLRAQVTEYSGTYEGVGNYAGDRRYDPFETSYEIQVRVRSRSDIAVDWQHQVRKSGGQEWSREQPSMAIKRVQFGSGLLWGDMYFTASTEQRVTAPFLAAFVKRSEDSAPGLILFGRYEGPVFLRRHP